VYGGMAVPSDSARELSCEIDELRVKSRGPRDFHLKFNSGPKDSAHEEYIGLKQSLIEASIRHGARLFVSLILHDIVANPNETLINEINRGCYHFDCVLNQRKRHDLVRINRFEDRAIDSHFARSSPLELPVSRIHAQCG
jgi:hypothetical protein